MALVTSTELLARARKEHYAVPAFNANCYEMINALIRAAEAEGAPLIVQIGKKWLSYLPADEIGALALHLAKKASVPVCIHLDHGADYAMAKACLESGFTSVMYDGSHEETFELNLQRTAEVVKAAHAKGISVEAEVGGIGGVEDGVASNGELADPQQCKAIADLGVDFLACGIGNIHGIYPENWAGLSFDRLQEIKALTGDLPLVLHGGTGIPVDQIQKAISLGISKINVNTDLQVVFAEATRKYIEEGKDQQGKGYDPRKLLKPGRDAIKARTAELMREFGSDGKGWA